MACYNPDTEEFESLCRVMTGFSDSFYKEVICSPDCQDIFIYIPFSCLLLWGKRVDRVAKM